MAELIASSNLTLIVGTGITGLSVACYLADKGERFCFADEHVTEQTVTKLNQQFPDAKVLLGPFSLEQWQGVSQIILSPGVPRSHPEIAKAIEHGIPVLGDIELFAREASAPIVAITGSNGKSTVTKLVGEMAEACGINVAVGGNIGTPALALLHPKVDLYVLELSSFQLESTSSLKPEVATVLNISQDHLDRYKDLTEYFLTKQKIYFRAKNIVLNKDDQLTQPPIAEGVKVCQFTLKTPDLQEYGLIKEDDSIFLAKGLKPILNTQELQIRGSHNFANALAALAIGDALNFQQQAMISALKKFKGLPHRCVLVERINGVDYVNDSKATNVGSTIAAIRGLSNGKNIVLIAGGEGKGADFSELSTSVSEYVKKLIVLGKDAQQIAQACAQGTSVEQVNKLAEAVKLARRSASAGDVVLLSPACASLDMFSNYSDRGNQFAKEVKALCP